MIGSLRVWLLNNLKILILLSQKCRKIIQVAFFSFVCSVEPQQNQQNDWFSKSMARKHLKYCTAALKELKKHPSAGLFLEPVDPIKYGIPDYFDIIKQPMDLGTVESKLDALQYTTVADFELDVRLIFSNCILYNGVDHPVSQQARELESLFK